MTFKLNEQAPLPCPFCGKKVDLNDPDVLYPSGTGWTGEGDYVYYTHYLNVPQEQWCYVLVCPETSGGCGVEMHGDGKEEVIKKWNRRKA